MCMDFAKDAEEGKLGESGSKGCNRKRQCLAFCSMAKNVNGRKDAARIYVIVVILLVLGAIWEMLGIYVAMQ